MAHTHNALGEYGLRLAALRDEIDAADSELLRLLNARALLSLDVGRLKAQMSQKNSTGIIFDPQRERRVLENLAAGNNGPLPLRHIESIWREIFSSSRALQRPQRVAYLGPEGTFSHHAALNFLGSAPEFIAWDDLPAVFRAVLEGNCDLGIVPLENSLQGSVGQTLDLFLEHDLYIQAELFQRISHSLISLETSPEAVHIVYSHSQPLAQCAKRLKILLPGARLVPVESTAAAACRAAQEPGSAALGHRALAESLHLHLLAEHMEDTPDNRTRFSVIGRKSALPQTLPTDSEHAPMISSLLFTLPDKVGALAEVLNTLASAELNLRKLESRPLRDESWKYAFFADVEGDLEAKTQEAITTKLSAICARFRILGVYPSGFAS